MSTEKENDFTFCGTVDAPPEIQYTDQGKCKGRLKVKRTETWQQQGETKSKDVILTFSFFGKPAEDVEKLALGIGTAVRVAGQFGSWPAKNKDTGELTGMHFPDLKGWRVDVRTVQATPPPSDDDIQF